MESAQQLCTFLLEGNLFGVPVPQVQEVIRFQQMTHVPLAPEVIQGMINLRGQIVIAIDLRCRLSLPNRTEPPMNVVVRTVEGGAVSLLVDEIGDVIEVDPSSFEEPPETVSEAVRGMILGVHKLEGKLLHVLDTEKACQIPAAAEAAAAAR